MADGRGCRAGRVVHVMLMGEAFLVLVRRRRVRDIGGLGGKLVVGIGSVVGQREVGSIARQMGWRS